MSDQRKPVHLQEGYQPKASAKLKAASQYQTGGTLDHRKLKPPTGDTAIQPPKPPAGDTSS
jgi:hypothetical protein